MWNPEKRGESWVVVDPESPLRGPRIRSGGDGMPLRFWSEKGAQVHADSMNEKEYDEFQTRNYNSSL